MHRCLQVTELVAHILAALGPDPMVVGTVDTMQRRANAAMARTCKTLYEPAMDALWSLLVSLDPLIKCLPQDTWEMSDNVSIVRGPRGSEWERFLRNSSRVQRLKLANDGGLGRQLRMLCIYLPTAQSPFSNLRILDAFSLSLICASHISFILGPQLCKVLVGDCADGPVCTLMGQLSMACPKLQALEMYCRRDTSAIVGRFKYLKEFKCVEGEMTAFTLANLAASPSLLTFSSPLPPLSAIEALSPAESFITLVRLELYILDTGHSLSQFLRHIHSSSLRDLILDFREQDNLTIKPIFQEIAKFSSLANLTIYGRPTSAPMPSCGLEPLLKLSQLQRVIILHDGVQITRENIPVISRAWPLIRHLRIQPCTQQMNSTPLDALGLFAEHMPNLQTLGISLDAAVFPVSSIVPARSTALATIFVERSVNVTLASVKHLALHISDIYPNARLGTADESPIFYERGDEHLWSELYSLFDCLSEARRQERRRISLA